jgi:hypothetical protein
VCPIAVHDARHTCATQLVDLDVYTCVIMRLLRHADQASRWRSTQTRARPPRARHSGGLASPCTRWSSMSRKRTMSGVVVAVLLCCTPSQPAGSTASNLALTSENSGANGTRTRNPLLAKQVRYQLRHGPVVAVALVGAALRLRFAGLIGCQFPMLPMHCCAMRFAAPSTACWAIVPTR